MKRLFKLGLIIIAALLLCVLIYCFLNKKKEYTKNLYYMDTYIYVKIYEKSSEKAEVILNEVEQIYREYHELTDRYNHYDGIFNIYDIHNNTLEDETLTLDQKLYDILEFAYNWHKKYYKLNIEMGDIIDVWKKYRDTSIGIPTLEELNSASNYVELVLLDDNQILNNQTNLDLGSVAKGYATEKVGEYLESIGVEQYLINAGGNVKVGKAYNKDYYKIGVQSPSVDGNLLTVVKGNNISVVTSGDYERNYTYNGKEYHHIIDPDTLFPSEYMKSVTVICKDSSLGDVLSTILFLMSVEDGQEFIKNSDVEAIWYTNDNQIIRSEGFSSYE